ncbi:hypothetical protein AB0H76_24230 [Nocardia sp. NPDC050712]|uniref:hypothetical protein n=1 Tax=Nocardia sp. NPDC050712 TaxID=3155518 RepID=UPI0033E38C85
MHAHNPAQVIRHTAIVLAGVASIGLTGAAGAYIMGQMSDLQRAESAAPPALIDRHDSGTDEPGLAPHPTTTAAVLLTSEHHRLPGADIAPPQPVLEPAVPQVFSTTPPPSTGLTGTLRLGETTYVGAQVAPVRSNTFAITLDTNVFSTLSNFLLSEPIREGLGTQPEQAGVTSLRTEFDSSAGVTLVFSDPALGEHAIQLNRNPADEAPSQPTSPSAPGTITV